EMYRLTIRLTDKEFISLSTKIANKSELVYKSIKTDGRFETSKLHKIKEFEGEEEFVYDITTETGHFHCNGLIQHNCFNYSTYDILTKGLPMVKKISSLPPKHLYAFKSQLEQFTIIASNSTLGATGLADMLVVMSYFVNNILVTKSDAHFKFASEEDCWNYVRENIVSFIYTINQPMRANQSPFTNISVYDDNFLEGLCADYLFPDGSTPNLDIVRKLQELYLNIMNEEMRRTPITFPVTTACISVDKEGNVNDMNFVKLVAKQDLEFGFINIYTGDSSTLSSCCRLRSDKKNEYFNSFGAGSSKIGSLGVVSINFPRLAMKNKTVEKFKTSLKDIIEVCARINNAKRHVVKKRIENGNHPLYTLGYMDLSKQYSTVGVNGFNECIQLLGSDILTTEGQELGVNIIKFINTENDKLGKLYNAPHNCEQVPAENMSIKMAEKDKMMGFQNGYNIYSNQFIPLTTNADLLDRIMLQGKFDKHFSGGAICHLNIDTRIEDENKLVDLIVTCAK
ncbi:MAG TPA: anaerobic ribonucleoside-triphosphate reductase, partial [Clostridium sp.]